MMKTLMPIQWIEFQENVAVMADNSSPREILNMILSWLRKHSDIFFEEPFATYRFDNFLLLNEVNLPVDTSLLHGVEFEHFKRIIGRYSARDTESIARYLRDTLETLVIMEVDKKCSRCECWSMRVYKNCQDGRIAFECRQCGFSNYLDGSRASVGELVFASNDDLRGAGLI